MTAYYISMIPFANMGPYRQLGEPEGGKFVNYTPKQSISALQSGRVIAAPVPVAALPVLGNTVEYLGAYGIAAESEVGSVLLFSSTPFTQITKVHRIFITEQSASSVTLLYLLLKYQEKSNGLPLFTREEKEADAVLYIGDQALCQVQQHDYPYVIDLVSLWHNRHSLPFVFARWVVGKNISAELKKTLISWLQPIESMDDQLVSDSADREAIRLGLTTSKMISYLKGMKRALDQRCLQGQELFFQEIETNNVQQEITWIIGNGAYRDNQQGVLARKSRLTRSDALRLFTDCALGSLMRQAFEKRNERYPDNLVTYVRDTNPNYTNICETKCRFCAFNRNPEDQDAYMLSPDQLANKVKQAQDLGATTVLLQGGHNPTIGLDNLLNYIRVIKKACPHIHIHPFSPSELFYIASKEKLAINEVLVQLKAEGIDTIPGGGGEILVDPVRNSLAPNKCTADDWLQIMSQAHELGFKTTATMMYGHIETDEDIVEHLFRLRDLQDITKGFSSFIPWSYKPGNNPLTETIGQVAHSALYVKIIALARLVLDNFDHIQSSWFSENERAGSLGLLAGADDFGGLLIEENVLATTGHKRKTTEEKVQEIIKSCGFTPALRDSHYQVLKIFNDQ